nr:leucine-rich repeat protein [Tanacetum cinerariifolium]
MVDFIEASPLRTVTESSLRRNLKLQDEEGISSLPDTELFENLTLMGYNISPNKNPKSTGFNEFSSNIATVLVCLATNRTYNFSKMIFDGLVKNVNNKISKFLMYPRIAQSSVPPTVADEPASPLRDVSQGEACPIDSGFIADQDRATIDKSSTLPHDSAPRVTSPVADEGKKEWLPQDLEMMPPIKGRSMDEGEAATERISDDSEEMATVLTSMDAATILASGVVDVPTGSGSIPTASTPAEEELEEQLEREDQIRSEQIARDVEIARIHAEEELQIMIDGLDRTNETVAKYLQEYHQFASELPIKRRIELITDLEEAKRIKRKGLNLEQESAKKQKTSEELVPIEEVYFEALQVKHPIIDWKVYTDGQRSYWKITRLGGSSASYQFFIDLLKHLDMEDLNKLWILVKETLSNRPPTSDKEMELWVELSRLYEPDNED